MIFVICYRGSVNQYISVVIYCQSLFDVVSFSLLLESQMYSTDLSVLKLSYLKQEQDHRLHLLDALDFYLA